jgi:hypothetical protein
MIVIKKENETAANRFIRKNSNCKHWIMREFGKENTMAVNVCNQYEQ